MNRQRNCGIYIQWNTIHPLKSNEIILHATTWVYLEYIILSKISQTQVTRGWSENAELLLPVTEVMKKFWKLMVMMVAVIPLNCTY